MTDQMPTFTASEIARWQARQQEAAARQTTSPARTTGHQPGTRCGRLLAGTPGTWTDCDLTDGHNGPHTARQTTGQDDTGPTLRDRLRRAICEAEGFTWDTDMLEPDEYGDHADAVLQVLGEPLPERKEFADPTTADDPTPLRWGLGDVLHGDDETTTVCLSGPGPDHRPYWLELDAERAAAFRDDLTPPSTVEPQDHPGADLYVRLRKAGEDHDTAQALIYAHARMAVREHTAIHGDTPAVGQPAEAHDTDRCPSCDHQWTYHDADGQCWFTVDWGRPGSNLVCPCAPRPEPVEGER